MSASKNKKMRQPKTNQVTGNRAGKIVQGGRVLFGASEITSTTNPTQ
jgi:hypothetical protein